MRIGPAEVCQFWQGRPVQTSDKVLIDGKETSLQVRWFDPDNDTYGFLVTDQDGRQQLDPDDDNRLWIAVGQGKVTLEWDEQAHAHPTPAQGL